MLPSGLLALFAIFAQTKLSATASSSSSSPSSPMESNNKSPTFRTVTIHFDKDVQACTNVCLSICHDGDKHASNEITPPASLKAPRVQRNVSKTLTSTTADPRDEEENEFEVINNMPKNFRIASGMIREVEGDSDDGIMTSSEEKPGPPIMERLILQDDRVGDSATTTDPDSVTTTAAPDSSDATTTTTSAEKMATTTATPGMNATTVTTMSTDASSDNSSVTTTSSDAAVMNATTTAPANVSMTTTPSANETSMTMPSTNGAAFRSDSNGTSNSTQGQENDGFDDVQNETKPAAPATQQKNIKDSGVKGGSQTAANPDIDIVTPIINGGTKGGTKGGGGLARSPSMKSGKKFRSPSAAARQRSLNRVKKEDRSSAVASPSNGYRRRRKSNREGNARRRSRNSSRVRVSNKKRNAGGRRRSSAADQSQGNTSRRQTWSMERLPDSHDPGYADVPYRASTLSRRYARPPQRACELCYTQQNTPD